MIFNIMLFIAASTYWYLTGHATPAVIGYILILMYKEDLAFVSILTAGAGISAVVYCFWLDFFEYKVGDEVLVYGMGIIYMLVLYIKARKLFYNDEFSLD
ncbi:hypothetical protein N9A28_01835 [Sulfurimonas sp.]|nr:hypothetical protein [Sulfurimonas sp.]